MGCLESRACLLYERPKHGLMSLVFAGLQGLRHHDEVPLRYPTLQHRIVYKGSRTAPAMLEPIKLNGLNSQTRKTNLKRLKPETW